MLQAHLPNTGSTPVVVSEDFNANPMSNQKASDNYNLMTNLFKPLPFVHLPSTNSHHQQRATSVLDHTWVRLIQGGSITTQLDWSMHPLFDRPVQVIDISLPGDDATSIAFEELAAILSPPSTGTANPRKLYVPLVVTPQLKKLVRELPEHLDFGWGGSGMIRVYYNQDVVGSRCFYLPTWGGFHLPLAAAVDWLEYLKK